MTLDPGEVAIDVVRFTFPSAAIWALDSQASLIRARWALRAWHLSASPTADLCGQVLHRDLHDVFLSRTVASVASLRRQELALLTSPCLGKADPYPYGLIFARALNMTTRLCDGLPLRGPYPGRY